MSCSHVLLWVRDLHRAVRDYRQLGFRVDYATAEAKAQHAHIWFRSGPAIELLTAPATAKWFKWPLELAFGRGAGHRMVRWTRNEGFCDVAVAVNASDLTHERRALARAGIPVGRVVRWTRTKPDGARVRFQFAYPRNEHLPFLVTPYDTPQCPPDVHHPNGAIALRQVRMAVHERDLAAVRRLVGDDPTFVLEPGENTHIRDVVIAGLSTELDSALLHGATIFRVGDEQCSKAS
ncbi:VOC family protein [Pendulispora brunnea]|uniref:VOC family protein n=1 Tax=Pendulispora brunnea TaxID=2905690 RepID=A0ABZ2K596_9BACT